MKNKTKSKTRKKSIIDSLAGSIKISKSKRGIPFEKVLAETKKIAARKLALDGIDR